ncbi:hypothetical protein WA158_002274 [Blastocystis sp. Blastoise]
MSQTATVLEAYEASSETELTVQQGEIVNVISVADDWAWCEKGDEEGYIPVDCLQISEAVETSEAVPENQENGEEEEVVEEEILEEEILEDEPKPEPEPEPEQKPEEEIPVPTETAEEVKEEEEVPASVEAPKLPLAPAPMLGMPLPSGFMNSTEEEQPEEPSIEHSVKPVISSVQDEINLSIKNRKTATFVDPFEHKNTPESEPVHKADNELFAKLKKRAEKTHILGTEEVATEIKEQESSQPVPEVHSVVMPVKPATSNTYVPKSIIQPAPSGSGNELANMLKKRQQKLNDVTIVISNDGDHKEETHEPAPLPVRPLPKVTPPTPSKPAMPAPLPTKPLPLPSKPTPSKALPLPAKPLPLPAKPIHSSTKPLPLPAKPLPKSNKPLPLPAKPLPLPAKPMHSSTKPLPLPAKPLPTPSKPLPTPSKPLPLPAKPLPTPTKALPIPTKALPTPAKPLPKPATSQAEVLYAYNAQTNEELSIREGEVVDILVEGKDGWDQGKNASGQVGYFPHSYIKMLSASSASPVHTCVALYDYTATNGEELTIYNGEQLHLVSGDEGGWTQVKNTQGRTGLVPTAYIE